MFDYLARLFSSDFMPHGHCYQWLPEILWLHVISDGLIAFAYFSIPISLIYFVKRRKDLEYRQLFVLFGAFILFCGLTHVLGIWTVWHGTYRLSGLMKAGTAVVSVATAIALVPVIPRALRLPSPSQLAAANKALQEEVAERIRVEEELRATQAQLQELLDERSAALQQTEKRYERIVETASEGIWMIGPDDGTTFVNSSMAKLLGYTTEEMTGTPIHEYIVSGDEDLIESKIEKRRAGEGEIHEFRLQHRDGHTIWVLVNTTPLLDENGDYEGALAMITEITQLKEAQEALEERARALERSNEDLEAFASVASHDLKAPLRAINNLASWVVEDAASVLPPEPKRYLEMLQDSTARMENLLENLLTYARAGQFETSYSLIDTRTIVEECVDLLAPPPSLTITLDDDLPTFETAGTPFKQVWLNLISNAIRHHDREDGTIAISREADEADYYVFSIRDDGPGIPERLHKRVFKLLQTYHRTNTNGEGTGLGLALIKKLIEREGGRIWLTSPGEERGTTFFFTWPKHG